MEALKTIVAVIVFMLLAMFLAVPAVSQFSGGPGESYGDPMARGDQMGPMGPMGPQMPMGPFSERFGMWPSTPNYNVHDTNRTILGFMGDYPELSLYIAALKATGYDKDLDGSGPFVVFAINDTAMGRDLSIRGVSSIYSNPDLVRGLVESSIVRDSQWQGSRVTGQALRSVNGMKVTVGRERNGLVANGADITDVVKARNGVLYVVEDPVGT